MLVKVAHGEAVKLVQCSPGMSVEEIRAVLAAAFGAEGVVGLQSKEGVISALSFLCKAPSYFANRADPFVLLCKEQPLKMKKQRRSFEEVVAEDETFRAEFGDDAFDLKDLKFEDVLNALPSGRTLSEDTFRERVEELVDDARRRAVFWRVWRCVAEVHKSPNEVCASALLAALSSLTDAENMSEIFHLFDQDGSGAISKLEMERFFYAVFLVQREKRPSRFRTYSLLALAEATAEHAFESADLDHDGSISFAEFRTWFHSHSHRHGDHSTTALLEDDDDEVVSEKKTKKTMTLKYLLDLFFPSDDKDDVETQAERLFDALSAESHLVSRSRALAVLVETRDEPERKEERLEAALAIFALFDPDETGVADAAAVAAGVSALACVSDDDFFAAPPPVRVFLGGVFSRASLEAYLKCAFALKSLSSDASVDDLAADTTDACFGACSPNANANDEDAQRMSASTFAEWWVSRRSKKKARLMKTTREAVLAATCLDAFSLHDVDEVFRKSVPLLAEEDALAEGFLTLRQRFADRRGLPYDRDEDEALFRSQGGRDVVRGLLRAAGSFKDAVMGLSALCRTDAGDVFDLLSEDGVTVKKADIGSYLAAVFRVEALLDAEDFQEASRQEKMFVRDVTRTVPADRMTCSQFAKWFTASCSPFPLEEKTPLQTAASRAGLRDLDAAKAVATLADRADRSGYVDKKAFVDALSADLDATKDPSVRAALGDIFDIIRQKTSIHVHEGLPEGHLSKPPPPDKSSPRRGR